MIDKLKRKKIEII